MKNNKLISVTFDINVSDTSKPMKLLITLDDDVIIDTKTTNDLYRISCDFLDDDTTHSIKVHLSEKTNSHTIIKNDKIISSAQLEITNFLINGLDIFDILSSKKEVAKYLHNSNNPGNFVEHYYDPIMGFNGIVEFNFKTPVYAWLFDNL